MSYPHIRIEFIEKYITKLQKEIECWETLERVMVTGITLATPEMKEFVDALLNCWQKSKSIADSE